VMAKSLMSGPCFINEFVDSTFGDDARSYGIVSPL
jgi:hypothetical protein